MDGLSDTWTTGKRIAFSTVLTVADV